MAKVITDELVSVYKIKVCLVVLIWSIAVLYFFRVIFICTNKSIRYYFFQQIVAVAQSWKDTMHPSIQGANSLLNYRWFWLNEQRTVNHSVAVCSHNKCLGICLLNWNTQKASSPATNLNGLEVNIWHKTIIIFNHYNHDWDSNNFRWICKWNGHPYGRMW